MRQWRLICDSPMRGAENMAIDETILTRVGFGESLPTLRLYAWEPMCLSLGYGQRVRDVDQNRLQQAGWELVRRPTGGRAILHGDEFTYSLAVPPDHFLAQGDIVESYRQISQALMRTLELLGMTPQAERLTHKTKGEPAPVCFEVPSHYEITSNGKKLVGSAQMRRKAGMLQHGTIPLYGDISRICDALVYEDEASREQAKQIVRDRAITLEGALGHEVSWDELAEAILQGFAEVFAVEYVDVVVHEDEFARVNELLENVYENSAWTEKR